MSANSTALKYFGIFFIGSFIFYAVGHGMIESAITNPADLLQIQQSTNKIIIGAFLIIFCHTFTNIGLVVILFSVFKDKFSLQAYAYLGLAITSTIFLAIGGVCLLLIVPLNKWATDNTMAQLSVQILQKGQFYCYQFGMMFWCVGGLILCNLLLKTGVVAKWLTLWGFLGYVIFMAGCVFEIFGIAIGIYTSIVGGLFEITLSLMAIFKGFKQGHFTKIL